MKKLIAIALVVALVITALAVAIPVGAAPGGVKGPPGGNKAVFESDIIDIPGNDELTGGGEVCVRSNGDVKVEITGAPLDKTYLVVLAYGEHCSLASFLGSMTEYDDGEYKLETSLSSAIPELPLTLTVGGPVFVILDSEEAPQFVSGFSYTPTP